MQAPVIGGHHHGERHDMHGRHAGDIIRLPERVSLMDPNYMGPDTETADMRAFEYRLHDYYCKDKALYAWLPTRVPAEDAMGYVLRLAALADLPNSEKQ
jgi:hypothetical protein